MDTYVTVSIDVRTILLICLSSFSICVFISLIYEQMNKSIRLSNTIIWKFFLNYLVTLQIDDEC